MPERPHSINPSAAAVLAPRYKHSHRWKVLTIGVAANASFAAAFSGIPTTAVFIRSDYHIKTTELGLILGAMGLGIALSELPWGLLTDKLGDRKVLLAGLGLTGAMLAFMARLVSPLPPHIPSAALLGLSLLLLGLIGGSVNGSSGRAIMAWFKEGERGLAMSIRQTAVPGGGAIGALILPSIAAYAGFQAVYAVLALFCAATTLFVWLWLHEPPEHIPSGTDTVKASPAPTASPLRNAQVWRTVFGLGALCIPQVAVLTFAAVFLHDFGHLGVAAISASIVAVQVGAAMARIWSGHFTDHRSAQEPPALLKGMCSVDGRDVHAARRPCRRGVRAATAWRGPYGRDCSHTGHQWHLRLLLARHRVHRTRDHCRYEPCRHRAWPGQHLRFWCLFRCAVGHTVLDRFRGLDRRLDHSRWVRATGVQPFPTNACALRKC